MQKDNKDLAFEKIAKTEAELLERLEGDELRLLNDLIEAWTEYCDEIKGVKSVDCVK